MAEFIRSPNYTSAGAVPNEWGVRRSFQVVVIHWWNNPAERPSIEGVIATFKNLDSDVSAHYVVNNSRTVQMVQEEDAAWHAKQANPFSIGIECDPNGGEAMYRRLGELVRDIRSRRGNLPLAKHSIYVQTACPGNIDLVKIESYSRSNQGGNVAATATNPDNGEARDAQGWLNAYIERNRQWRKDQEVLIPSLRKQIEELKKAGGGKALSDYSVEERFKSLVDSVK